MPHLVQLLLPVRDNHGTAHRPELFRDLAAELSQRFGGVTAYTRSPAEGLWQADGDTHHDDMVAVEVMVGELDAGYWHALRRRLEIVFRQRELLVYTHEVQIL